MNEDIFSEDSQEELPEIKCNSICKNNFEAILLIDFWAKYVHNKSIGAVAMRTHTPSVLLTTCAKVAFLPKYKDKTQEQTLL